MTDTEQRSDSSAEVAADRPKALERPHPLTPLIRGWVVLVAFLVYFAKDLIPTGEPRDLSFAGPRLIFVGVAAAILLAAVAGFVTWYFTRFVIDEDEFRIESGALVKRSRKIAYERVQSVDIVQRLAARVFGLAELRIEVGAGDSTVKIGFLRRDQADRLRNFILERAHGDRPGPDKPAAGPGASAFTDLDHTDQKLVTVNPQRLLTSFLLSMDFLVSLGVVLVLVVVGAVVGRFAFVLPLLIPFGIGLVTLVGNRLINMFNFTLAESPRGFRIVRGLTNLTSQSLPINRIQGVRISQSLLWKRFGWFRVDVNVLGVASSNSEDNERSATSVLLPVADTDELRRVLDRILPDLDLDRVPLQPASPRVRTLRWYDHWTLRAGVDDQVLVSDHGWLTAVRDVVPHAKVQSVRVTQGPLQRRLDVAHVHLDLTPGPVSAIARHLPAAAARELALTELDRMRTARASVTTPPVPTFGVPTYEPEPGPEPDPSTQVVLRRFDITPAAELGRGGEATVYALDADRVLRLYHVADPSTAATTHQLGSLYAIFGDSDFFTAGIVLPSIIDAGWIEGRWSSIDRRLPGQPFSRWLAEHAGSDHEAARRRALVSYLDAAATLRQLPSPVPGFTRLVGEHTPQTLPSLAELLTVQMSARLADSFARLEADVPDVERVWDELQDDLADITDEIDVEPALVHGDICPGNVFVEPDRSGSVRISAIADFSPHTLNADPVLDVVGAAAFIELEPYPQAAADSAWLSEQLAAKLGSEPVDRISAYRRFYAFYFSDTAETDPDTYAWCVRQLTSS